jgi:hypothetical protein
VPTVLIAAPAHLGVLKQRGEFRDALAFADHDALRAFETIVRQHADVVLIESSFAATSRGTAFINRIGADPTLSGCDVRVITRDDDSGEASTPAAGAQTAAVPDTPPLPPTSPAPPATPPPVSPATSASVSTVIGGPPPGAAAPDPEITSAATDFRSIRGIELLVDGTPATLIDLSTGGAQVMSSNSLKPHQRVRLTLPGPTPIRLNGAITWAMFEMPAGGPRYRAGVAFVDPDTAGIAAFIKANRQS